MGNSIVGQESPTVARVKLRNGLFGTFVSLLAVTWSRAAATEGQIRLATAIGCADQSILGRGCAGFDLRDLPWSRDPERFDAERTFALAAIDRAAAGEAHAVIGYRPDRDVFAESFAALRSLVETLPLEALVDREPDVPLMPDEPGELCPAHGCFVHHHGCTVCNDT